MTLPDTLPHVLDRTLLIDAEPETVFRFFTDSARWASWWGAGSTIDGRRGGRFLIRNPGGVEASGSVLDIDPPRTLVLSYGYVSGTPIPPDASRVTIRLVPEGDATRLHLAHEFTDAAVRDEHVQGWRFQLSLFANTVANEMYARSAEHVDAWFDAWSNSDADARTATLARIASSRVRFRDRFSAIDGTDDLLAHLAAAQRFMPGLRMLRESEIRHCQGVVLADWVARAADGAERGRGTNVFVFANGKIESVTGFWTASTSRSAHS
jgi:uncharacterized protein YndB with AHSA1/START domain